MKTNTCGVVTFKRHDAHAGMKFHAAAKFVRCCVMK